MPKKNRSKKRGGGMFDWVTGSSSTTDGSLSTDGSSSSEGWFDSLKKKASSATSSASSWLPSSFSSSSSSSSNSDSTYPTATQGGRRRRKMRGGYSDSVSITNLASRAAPFSGSTARAHSYVGGRTKRRCHKHKGSRKHRCRK
jgi:hypothetical protein